MFYPEWDLSRRLKNSHFKTNHMNRKEYILKHFGKMTMRVMGENLNIPLSTVKYTINKLRKEGHNLPRKIKKQRAKVYVAPKRKEIIFKTLEIDFSQHRYERRDSRTWVLKKVA